MPETPERDSIQEAFSVKYQKILKPFMLRRTKKEVETDLPPKVEKAIYLGMTTLQAELYKEYIEDGTIRGRGYVNTQVQLRKICCHPYIFDELVPERLGKNVILASGKMIILDKLLEKLMQEDRRVLIFTQFLSMLKLLAAYCEFRKYRHFVLQGQTSLEDREDMITAFAEHRVDIFLLSTRAGNLGINLIAADTVILYDSDWNPQMDFQAMDRAYRIGQTKEVHVYRLITEHTVEQRIHHTQKERLRLDLNVVQKGRLFRDNAPESDSV
jgi:SWI/SNF-related matrix-associated actin-dependent regulator of chromatin subfamily A member 5